MAALQVRGRIHCAGATGQREQKGRSFIILVIVIVLVQSTRNVGYLAAHLAGEALAFYGRLEGREKA